MARLEKQKNISIEEQLETALVPEDEQPYEVPENWCWVRLGAVVKTSKEKTETFDDFNTKYVGLEHIEKDKGIVGYGTVDGIKSLKNVFHSGQILYGKLRPYLNKHDVADFDGVCSTDILVFDAGLAVNNCFLNYYFNERGFIEYAIRNSKGINLPRVSEDSILQATFPLSPLAEQQRIVERIESLFSKLDEARDKAQEALDGFEIRKVSILHQAFSGQLTTEWRRHNEFKQWENTTIGAITDIISSKRIYKEEYVDEGIAFFRSSEVVELYDSGYTEPNYYISRERYEEIKSKYGVPEKGDLLVTSVGTIGKTWIVDDREFYYKDGNLTQIKKCERLDMKYLQYYIMSNEFMNQVSDAVAGTAYNALTIVKFKNIAILLPSLKEQKEIVRLLNVFFENEGEVKSYIEQILEQIEMTKKSILAKAFRGELGTNDPEEESAIELLKQVLAASQMQDERTKRTKVIK